MRITDAISEMKNSVLPQLVKLTQDSSVILTFPAIHGILPPAAPPSRILWNSRGRLAIHEYAWLRRVPVLMRVGIPS